MPPAAISDEELRRLEPALLAYARRAVRSAELARDLVQETFLAAVQDKARFDGRSQLRTWLIGILSHKVMDTFRRAARERARASDEEPDDLTSPSSAASPERTLARREAIRALETALGDLPELERVAVLMVDVEQVDHPVACNALDVSATHLRVLLHRGRHRLRKRLEDVHLRRSP